jgi:hypothetical protein
MLKFNSQNFPGFIHKINNSHTFESLKTNHKIYEQRYNSFFDY